MIIFQTISRTLFFVSKLLAIKLKGKGYEEIIFLFSRTLHSSSLHSEPLSLLTLFVLPSLHTSPYTLCSLFPSYSLCTTSPSSIPETPLHILCVFFLVSHSPFFPSTSFCPLFIVYLFSFPFILFVHNLKNHSALPSVLTISVLPSLLTLSALPSLHTVSTPFPYSFSSCPSLSLFFRRE